MVVGVNQLQSDRVTSSSVCRVLVKQTDQSYKFRFISNNWSRVLGKQKQGHNFIADIDSFGISVIVILVVLDVINVKRVLNVVHVFYWCCFDGKNTDLMFQEMTVEFQGGWVLVPSHVHVQLNSVEAELEYFKCSF